jgi:Y_Y_Y domain.
VCDKYFQYRTPDSIFFVWRSDGGRTGKRGLWREEWLFLSLPEQCHCPYWDGQFLVI